MPTMLDTLAETLGDALTPKPSPFISKIADTITINVPERMKYTIAVNTLMTFASQFRRNAELPDGTLCPANCITVIAAGSGVGKDSSHSMAQKAFKKAYNYIDDYVEDYLVAKAIQQAEYAGEELPTEPDVYNQYRTYTPGYETAFTSAPGLTSLAEELMDAPIGAPLVVTSEIADEYSSNKDTDELIKSLAISYDLGNIPAKNTKGKEFRSKKLEGVPVNALLMGSYNMLIHNESLRQRFLNSVASKLGRRSFIFFSNEVLPEPDFSNDPMKLLEYEDSLDLQAREARKVIEDYILDVAQFGISTANTPIKVSKDVDSMFKLYRRYNKDFNAASANPDSLNSLVRLHNQWRALKLAAALAFLEKSDTVDKHHYIQAMQFVEMLSSDLDLLEREIHKADHERFSDTIRTQVDITGKARMSIHDLKKSNYIKSTSAAKLHELVMLAAGYDPKGIYSVTADGGSIEYEPVTITDVLGISFKPIDTTELNAAVASGNADAIRTAKHNISVTTASNFELGDTSFIDLVDLLSGDFAYSPFKFRDGIRSKENIVGGTKWLVLDLDVTPISASETHFMLSDINHHVALSSDPDNEYKYRVIIELDANVELSPIAWKHFYLAIADDLALNVDPLPQSQIFFSYAGRTVLSNTDASPLATRDYIIAARERESERTHSDKVLTSSQKKAQIADPLTTFSYAFEAANGTGSRNIYRMMQHAKLLGASLDETLTLINDVNEYWESPMYPDRITKLEEQCRNLYRN